MASSSHQGDKKATTPASKSVAQGGITIEEGAQNLLAECEKNWPDPSDDSDSDSTPTSSTNKATTISRAENPASFPSLDNSENTSANAAQSGYEPPVKLTIGRVTQLTDRMREAMYAINGILIPLAESASDQREERKRILARVDEVLKGNLPAKAKHEILSEQYSMLDGSMAIERQDNATLVAAIKESKKKTKELLDASDTLGNLVIEKDSKLEWVMDNHKDARSYLKCRTTAVKID